MFQSPLGRLLQRWAKSRNMEHSVLTPYRASLSLLTAKDEQMLQPWVCRDAWLEFLAVPRLRWIENGRTDGLLQRIPSEPLFHLLFYSELSSVGPKPSSKWHPDEDFFPQSKMHYSLLFKAGVFFSIPPLRCVKRLKQKMYVWCSSTWRTAAVVVS